MESGGPKTNPQKIEITLSGYLVQALGRAFNYDFERVAEFISNYLEANEDDVMDTAGWPGDEDEEE